MFNEVIRPLLNMKKAGAVGITTPKGRDNFVSKLIDIVNDDGTPFFNVLHMTTICEACKKLPTRSAQLACNHSWIPTYKSREKQSRNAKIAAVLDSVSLTMQEDCGIIVPGADGCIFDPDHLAAAFDLSNPDMIFDDPTYVPNRIYLLSDPNADGDSNTTVFSCFLAPPRPKGGFERLVMLGLDVLRTMGGEEKDAMIIRHVKTIRNMAPYSRVPILAVFEANCGDYASRAEEMVLKNLTSVVTVHRGGPDGKPGIWLAREMKYLYVEAVRLAMDGARLVWSSRMFTNSRVYLENRMAYNPHGKSDVEMIVGDLWRR
jgi:hypothetical protein